MVTDVAVTLCLDLLDFKISHMATLEVRAYRPK